MHLIYEADIAVCKYNKRKFMWPTTWLLTFIDLLLFLLGYVCVRVYMWVKMLSERRRESDPLELELTGGCEPPDMGSRNQTWIVYKNSLTT